jgi:hypothetical protein
VPKSRLQEKFLRELAENFIATQRRIVRDLKEVGRPIDSSQEAVIRDALQGLFHGILVIFDGGTRLADHGLVGIVDEDGVAFDRFLHEIGFSYWPPDAPEETP